MQNHNKSIGVQLLQVICGCFQTSCRRYQREDGSAFQRSLESRMLSEARYNVPMPRI